MQYKTLKQISEIIAGYTFRGALENEANGQTKVLLAKNINENGTINYPELIRINQTPPRSIAYVSKNDVLLSSRGIFRAGVFDKESKNTIAASSVFILRIKDKSIIAEYLSIYLNSEMGQNNLNKILTGSTIKTILRRTLANLQIPVPSGSIQKKIINVINNWNKREKLLNQKINICKNISKGVLKHLLTN